MNKRIEELIKQAGGMEILDTRGFGSLHEGTQFTKEGMELFAKLLIQECIEIAHNPGNSDDPVWSYTIANEIKSHFGVK